MSSVSNSNSNNTMDEHLFEHSLSSSSSSTSSNIRGILKRTRTNLDKLLEEQRLKKIAKIVTIITFIVVYTPIIAFNLYFAYTDNSSCVLRESPIIGLSLYNYLTVQAYTMAFTLTLIILDDFVDNRDDTFFKTFYNNYILCYRVFSLSWIAIGVIIFIFITYNRLCSNGIHYYVAVVTVILAFSILFAVIRQYNYDSKLNNIST